MHTVVELDAFARLAKGFMSDAEREEVISFLAAHPDAGVSLGGGLRKVRIARQGAGKRGGFRVIYVFAGEHAPIFAVTVFAKNERANVGERELAELIALSKLLTSTYGVDHERSVRAH